MAVMVGEGGGIFALDRGNGQFLWATPFPFDDPAIPDLQHRWQDRQDHHQLRSGEQKTRASDIRFVSITRAVSGPPPIIPDTNSLYVPYIDNCLDMTSAFGRAGPEKRIPVPQPGSDPNKLTGIGKINLSTGEILHFHEGRSPSNGAMLTTAGDLVFHGDMNRRFHAFDVYTGKQLWEGIVGGHVSVSTIILWRPAENSTSRS